MRTVLGVGKQTPIPFLYFELGWTSPNIRHKLEMVRLWYHIVSLPENRLPKQIYQLDKTPWKKCIQSIFTMANMDSVFESDNSTRIPFAQLYDKIKKSLCSAFKDNLAKTLTGMSRLCYYKNFDNVQNFEQKSYIPACRNRQNRSVIAKLRSSTFNKIRVDSGRYRGIPREERICKRCENDKVDDEIHVLLYCSKFHVRRCSLIKEVTKLYCDFENLSDICKLEILLCKPDTVNLTARFILDCKF